MIASSWIVTDGKAGMESQCLGLAEALGLAPVIKRVRLRSPWKELSPHLRLGHRHAFTSASDPIVPPWPDLLIASGRQSIAASLYVRAQSRLSGRPAVTVQVQDPGISPSHFDLVVAPAHDGISGPNVVSTTGALHRITPQKLALEAARLEPRLENLPRPWLAVLIGGANGAYRFGGEEAVALAQAIVRLHSRIGGSLLVTPSRRTGEDNIAALKRNLGSMPAFVWDGQGDNPYFGMLGLADRIVVTSDSVNMVSEAVASGKPVHVFALPGGSRKFDAFHAAMRAKGYTHAMDGVPPDGARIQALDDMARAAEAVRQTMRRVRG